MHRSIAFILLCSTSLPAFADDAATGRAAPPGAVVAMIENHCIDCHDGPRPKAGLNLAQLSFDLRDRDAMDTWIKVSDRLAKGEMPPSKRERPAASELDAFAAAIRPPLHATSLDRQRSEGRVVLRRLNRVEFENTLADLLGVHVPVHDDLPADGVADGFDNVAAGNDVSGSHLVSYLEAIDRALDLALVRQKRQRVNERVAAGPYAAEKWKQSIGKEVTIDGESVIVLTNRPGHRNFRTALAPIPGRYRLRVACSAVNTQSSIPLAIHRRFASHFIPTQLVAFRDIAPGQPQVVELEMVIERSESLTFFASSLPASNPTGAVTEVPLDSPGLKFDWYEFEGPIGETWPSRSHRLLFGDLPCVGSAGRKALANGKPAPEPRDDEPAMVYSADPKADADRLLTAFARRAFRRPVEPAEIEPLLEMVRQRIDDGYEFKEAMRVGIKAILCSPSFLYLIESPGELDGYAVASRLSYFFWSTMPDDELMRLADAGELRNPEVLRAQVERLLNDGRAKALTENFVGQWLELRNINDTTPDSKLYPEFDEDLFWSMPRETLGFFDHMLRNDLSAGSLIDSDFLVLNRRLATHYGIAGVEGMELRVVPNPPGSHRGGVLTHASILKLTANGTITSPVRRGKFVLDNLLGLPPTPPPPSVGTIDPDTRGATTIREQLAKHRADPSCADCHRHIDPPGFALESYDAIGGLRTWYRASDQTARGRVSLPLRGKVWMGPDVDATGVTADGHKFAGFDEFQKLLERDRAQVARSVTEKLMTYATGAGVQYADRQVVEQIVADAADRDHGVRTLIHGIVQSRVFLHK